MDLTVESEAFTFFSSPGLLPLYLPFRSVFILGCAISSIRFSLNDYEPTDRPTTDERDRLWKKEKHGEKEKEESLDHERVIGQRSDRPVFTVQ